MRSAPPLPRMHGNGTESRFYWAVVLPNGALSHGAPPLAHPSHPVMDSWAPTLIWRGPPVSSSVAVPRETGLAWSSDSTGPVTPVGIISPFSPGCHIWRHFSAAGVVVHCGGMGKSAHLVPVYGLHPSLAPSGYRHGELLTTLLACFLLIGTDLSPPHRHSLFLSRIHFFVLPLPDCASLWLPYCLESLSIPDQRHQTSGSGSYF